MRDVIRVKSVRSHIEGDDVGYIRITQFNEQTTDGLKQGDHRISRPTSRADKLKGYILDLRNNPGGLLDQAIAVSTRSSTRARSSRPAAATPRRRSASTRGRAT